MRYVIIVVILVVLAFLVMDFNSRTSELNRLTAEHAIVKANRDAKAQTKAALEEKIAYATSEAAVYEWAYENHMIRPGDYPVIPVQVGQATSTPALKPIPTQTYISNFEKWLLLFIDPE
jgi:hypothetical protein